jgi:hypothetical protein
MCEVGSKLTKQKPKAKAARLSPSIQLATFPTDALLPQPSHTIHSPSTTTAARAAAGVGGDEAGGCKEGRLLGWLRGAQRQEEASG